MGDLRVCIQAFEEAWDEVVTGIPVTVDLYRLREAFGRRVLALVERCEQGTNASEPADAGPGATPRRPGRVLNELV